MGEGFFVLRVDSQLTAVKNVGAKELVQTKPNPFNAQFTIEHLPIQKELIELSIYQLNGELILQKSISGPTFEVETSGLNSGMYFVELRGSMFHWYQKIIKQ
jgi:hypothetical protein